MNENLKKYGIPVIIGIVVLYAVFKMSKGTQSSTSTINRLVPLQGENNTQQVNRDNARMAAFSNLAQVTGQQIAAKAQTQSESSQLLGLKESLISGQEIERIKAGLQRELGLQNLEGIKLQVEGMNEANRIASADRRYDIDQQLVASDRMIQAQQNLFTQQAQNAYQSLLAQINAVQSVGQTYRNQSLERQGTILNALTSIWNQPRVYDYQSAFGGARPAPFLEQLGGFFGNAGNAIRSFLPF